MRALEMVRVVCGGCGARETIDPARATRERCLFCSGNLRIQDTVPKRFESGLCPSGKYRYDGHDAAMRALRGHRRHGGHARRVYRCDRCRGWHLGSSIGRTG